MTGGIEPQVRAAAIDAGFDAVRITTLTAAADAIRRAAAGFDEFLADGRHGDMDWLAATAERRRDPGVLWPQARTAIVCAMSYAPADNPIATGVAADRGVVSAYARGRDYHDLVKSGLKRVARTLQAASGADVRVFVDTAPLLEKPLAAAAGIGWQGKHTNLVSRAHGSWLFLGVILTTAELAPDAAEPDHCGSCRRCLDICPTNAFPAPYQLDARRCIAYLTIEHKGHIAREFRTPIGNRVFGCDDCLAVCPWNSFAQTSREMRFAARPDTDNPPLAELIALDDAAFRARFAGTPVKRTGRDRIVRNALIAAGNAGDPRLLELIASRLDDASALVRAMAVWALGRIASAAQIRQLAERYAGAEGDAAVRSEWRHAGEEHAE